MDKLKCELCKIQMLDNDLTKELEQLKPTEEMLKDVSELFKVFGDLTRIRIINALFEKEMRVGEIVEVLDMTQSAISHQLRVLKRARLVKNRKEGKEVYYSLDDEHIKLIFDYGLLHIKELYY